MFSRICMDRALDQYLKIADLYESLHLIEKSIETLGVPPSPLGRGASPDQTTAGRFIPEGRTWIVQQLGNLLELAEEATGKSEISNKLSISCKQLVAG